MIVLLMFDVLEMILDLLDRRECLVALRVEM
jgi:hypothetical protein